VSKVFSRRLNFLGEANKNGKKLLFSRRFFFVCYLDQDVVRLIVSERERPAHDPEGNWVIQGGTPLDSNFSAWHQPHFADALTEHAANLDSCDGPGLTDFHPPQADFWHCLSLSHTRERPGEAGFPIFPVL
jgi:hypothetical protein